MAKSVVISGYYGFKNFGDEAILSSLISHLKSEKHHITVISSDPQYTKNKFQNIQSSKTFDIQNIIKHIQKSDILISGGGSLLQDATSLKSLLYYLFIIFIALFFKKKVIIFAQGIGPINSKFGAFITRNILKHCSYISVRDENSQQLLRQWNIDSDLVCDPIFSLNINKKPKKKILAVQLRDFKTITDDFINKLTDKIFEEFKDFPVRVYPFQQAIDTKICDKFINRYKNLNPDGDIELAKILTDEQLVNEISECEYLIAMRFHAIIIGIISEVKTLGINYDIKVKKICDEFDLPCIDIDGDFSNEFSKLKEINIEKIKETASEKHFDWSKFDKTLNR